MSESIRLLCLAIICKTVYKLVKFDGLLRTGMDLKPEPSCINFVPGNYEFTVNSLDCFSRKTFQTDLCILHQSCNNSLLCPKFGCKAENGYLLAFEDNLTPL